MMRPRTEAESKAADAEKQTRREAMIEEPRIPITDDERALAGHVSRWGSAGYLVNKLGTRWVWAFRSIEGPKVFKTKREAVAHFEQYLEALHDRLAVEAYDKLTPRERALLGGE